MSKKRSDTSKPPEPPPTIYLDEDIPRGIAEELRRYTEWHVEVHRDHYPHAPSGQDVSVADTEVLEKCGANEWILISADDKMRLVPANQVAAAAFNTRVFLFPRGNYKRGEYQAALIAGRFKLLRFARKNQGPFFARIRQNGEVYGLDRDAAPAAANNRDKTSAKYGQNLFEET